MDAIDIGSFLLVVRYPSREHPIRFLAIEAGKTDFYYPSFRPFEAVKALYLHKPEVS
jgi:hypothetical protein